MKPTNSVVCVAVFFSYTIKKNIIDFHLFFHVRLRFVKQKGELYNTKTQTDFKVQYRFTCFLTGFLTYFLFYNACTFKEIFIWLSHFDIHRLNVKSNLNPKEVLLPRMKRQTVFSWARFFDPFCQMSDKVKEEIVIWHTDHLRNISTHKSGTVS